MEKKPYKDEKPINTINRIKKIISNLGLSIDEHNFVNNKLYSSTITLSNNNFNLLNNHISTNGKGKSKELSLASAYGEFMERLQNDILIKDVGYAQLHRIDSKYKHFINLLKEEKADLNFYYDPFEKEFDTEVIIDKNKKIFYTIFNTNCIKEVKNIVIHKLGFKKLICVPFYNSLKAKKIYLPLELLFMLVGTNGMSSGNTNEEAIIQGICEIFERYVLKELYTKKITPPTVPEELFKNYEVFKIIEYLKSKGLTVIIKDLSLEKELPVIGVIIIDKKKYKYNFKAAADLRPEIALERCLTEYHQTQKKIKLNKIIGWHEYTNSNHNFSEQLNFTKIVSNSSGHIHKELFSSEETYTFKELNFSFGQSHKKDLNQLKKIIKKLNKEVYIRNVSFLKFPAFFTYIPGLSEIKFLAKKDFHLFSDFRKIKENLLRIKELNRKEFKNLVYSIEKWNKISDKFWKNEVQKTFLHNNNLNLKTLDVNLFLSISYYKLHKIKKAIKYLTIFIEKHEEKEDDFLYYLACRDYMRLKLEKKSTKEISFFLKTFYQIQIVNEVIEDLKNPEQVFNNLSLPNCFNCEKCELIKNCNFFKTMSIVKRLQIVKKEYYLEHKNKFLEQIFN